MKSVYVRVRETVDHVLVSVCDEELLGQTLIDGDIHFTVSKEFYGGDLVDTATCIKYLKNATIANMIGKTTVEAALEAGLIHKNAILYIQGEPHAQWMKL